MRPPLFILLFVSSSKKARKAPKGSPQNSHTARSVIDYKRCHFHSYSSISILLWTFSHKRLTFAFTSESGYTRSSSSAKSHTAAHRGKQGVFSCAAAWWQEGMENWSGDKETRAGDDALQLAIAGPSRRSPAGLRCPVRNLAMLLVFRSVHRCQRLALLFLRLCRFEEPSCVRLHHSHLSLISAAQNILAFCSALGHRSNQPRGHLLQHHLPIDHMSHLRYSTSIPTGKRSIAPPANRRIIISIGNNTMSKANANIFIAPHVSCKTNPAALTNKYAHRVKSAISIIFTTPER